MTMLQCCNVAMLSPYIFMLYWEFLGNDLEPNTGLKIGTPIWDPDLGPQFGTPIWDPDLGPRFEALWDPDLGPRISDVFSRRILQLLITCLTHDYTLLCTSL
jgi:hypothetical protein